MNGSSTSYEKLPLYMSMAGRGNPWGALTTLRKQLMRGLYDQLTLSELAEAFELSVTEIKSELAPLVSTKLVKEVNESYQPAFFIANGAQTQRITDHASRTGQALAAHLWNRWDDLEAHYSRLSVSENYSFHDLAFLLVGGRLLDIGLLEALAKDKTLFLPAPARPSPDRPDARYYFWMIEGDLTKLGKYGQEDVSLPWANWHFLTFGQNFIDGQFNNARQALEEKSSELVDKKLVENPHSLAEQLNVPLVAPKDAEYWLKIVKSYSEELNSIYKDSKDELRGLFVSLDASRLNSDYFGDFFCWYAHYAYACAIDDLVMKGAIKFPTHHFMAALWYREQENEGLLTAF